MRSTFNSSIADVRCSHRSRYDGRRRAQAPRRSSPIVRSPLRASGELNGVAPRKWKCMRVRARYPDAALTATERAIHCAGPGRWSDIHRSWHRGPKMASYFWLDVRGIRIINLLRPHVLCRAIADDRPMREGLDLGPSDDLATSEGRFS